MRAILIDLESMTSVDEAPVESMRVTDATNGAGDGDITVSLGGRPQAVEHTRPWRYGVGVTDDAYNPLWLGIITRRSASAASRKYRLSATQVEGWLARVWLPDQYDASADADMDGADAIALRLGQLASFQASHTDRLQIPLPTNPPAPTGRSATFSWESPWTAPGRHVWGHPYSKAYANPVRPHTAGDSPYHPEAPAPTAGEVLDWRGEPTTVLDDLNIIGDQGFSWGLFPVERGGRWGVELRVRPVTLDIDRTIQVGLDVADAEIVEDGDAQVTEWMVLGGAGAALEPSPSRYPVGGYPLLMATRTYEQVGTQPALDALARDLASAYGPAPLSTSSIVMPGVVRVVPGDVVELVVPPALYSNWPDGNAWTMRAASVTWQSERGAASTEVEIIAPRDQITGALNHNHVVPSAREDLAGVLNNLAARLSRLESRK